MQAGSSGASAGGGRHQLRTHGEGGRLWPPVDLGQFAGTGRAHAYVHHVIVDEDRPDVEFTAEVEGCEQAVVDDHLAAHAGNARGCNLACERIVAGQRIGGGEWRAAKRIGLVMVEVGQCETAIRIGSPAHRHIAAGYQYQVAAQLSPCVDRAAPVHRRAKGKVGTQRVEQHPDREQFAHGADQKRPVGIDVVENLACRKVDDLHAPDCIAIERLVKDLANARGNGPCRFGAAASACCQLHQGKACEQPSDDLHLRFPVPLSLPLRMLNRR